MFIFFVIGALLGSIIGSGGQAETVFTQGGEIYSEDGYAALLFSVSKYHLLILLGATSFIGVAIIPLICAFRGFVLACTASYLAASFADDGLLLTMAILGLPSLLTMPALFALACGGLRLSLTLLSCLGGAPVRPAVRPVGLGLLLIPCAAALCAAAAVQLLVVPSLVRLII